MNALGNTILGSELPTYELMGTTVRINSKAFESVFTAQPKNHRIILILWMILSRNDDCVVERESAYDTKHWSPQ